MRTRMAILWMVVPCALAFGWDGAAAGDPPPPFEVEIEGGAVWQTVNDVQIPNDASGTRFSIVDVIGSGPYPAGRMYFTWNVNERHGVRLLLAPFSVTDTGEIAAPVHFAGETFEPGEVQATYRFNSWRATYRYRFRSGERATWWIGFTAKIRDAKIELDQEGATARKIDVGFVPLLHFAGSVRLREGLFFVLDLDALAGGPGARKTSPSSSSMPPATAGVFRRDTARWRGAPTSTRCTRSRGSTTRCCLRRWDSRRAAREGRPRCPAAGGRRNGH